MAVRSVCENPMLKIIDFAAAASCGLVSFSAEINIRFTVIPVSEETAEKNLHRMCSLDPS